ncbi:MAG: hypothetical protein L0Z55_10545 [Planctomycetes bacterium]|nr:hypothetical protein [Planctomycetota bacterium]
MAAQAGRPLRPGGTTQGLYIAAADGRNFGYVNHRSPERVLAEMEDGLARFREKAAAHATFQTARGAPRGVESAGPTLRRTPTAAAVVRVHARIGPLSDESYSSLRKEQRVLNAAVGRDHLWILEKERRALLESAGVVANAVQLPPTLSARILRFHLVDNVRGEPEMWRSSEVRRADCEATLIRASRDSRTFAFRIEFLLATSSGERGYEGRLEGEIELAAPTAALVRFRAYSFGEAWGSSIYTPGAPPGRFPLTIAMVNAPEGDGNEAIVPPQASSHFGEYLRPALSITPKP